MEFPRGGGAHAFEMPHGVPRPRVAVFTRRCQDICSAARSSEGHRGLRLRYTCGRKGKVLRGTLRSRVPRRFRPELCMGLLRTRGRLAVLGQRG